MSARDSLRAKNVPVWSSRLMTIAAILLGTAILVALTDPSRTSQAFEVASIRLVAPYTEDLQKGIGLFSVESLPTNLFTARNASLSLLIQIAYSIDDQHQISAKPDWMESQLYDISAKVEGDQQLTLTQMRPILQRLLEQRFHLQTHRETKPSSGYVLVQAKGGAKLKPSKDGRKSYFQILPNALQATHSTAKDLTGALTIALHEPVVDKTGLTGTYDIDLSYAPINDSNSTLPSIFTALQEQVGLKLESQKVPVETLVIDHADKIPTEN